MRYVCAIYWACAYVAACSPPAAESEAAPTLTREALLDPVQCQSCHPRHYEEWSSSMHAYAAQDPVFIAMNQRGQRETGGELGTFCVQCHAPLAVWEGATHDGLDLDTIPDSLKGVTCYVCHNAIAVGEHFNNGLALANDSTLRAAIREPMPSAAHTVSYGALQDSDRRESSQLCGSCHDVVTPSAVHLERTFEEYEHSLFGQLHDGFETCGGCHMPGRTGRAAELPQAPERIVHDHRWPGVDVALTPFPGNAELRRAVECELSLNTRIRSITHDGFGTFTVQAETSAGHRQPSGAAQDRRMWLEVIAYDHEDRELFASGRIADTELEEKPNTDPDYDPQLSLFRDWTYDAEGAPTHDFWRVARSPSHPEGYESLTLPFAIDPVVPHTLSARYTIAQYSQIARLTVRLRMRPIGMDVLQALRATGDLESDVIAQMPTFTLHGAAVEWRPDERELRSLLPADLRCMR